MRCRGIGVTIDTCGDAFLYDTDVTVADVDGVADEGVGAGKKGLANEDDEDKGIFWSSCRVCE